MRPQICSIRALFRRRTACNALAIWLVGMGLVPGAAGALTVDNFEEGDFSLSAPIPPPSSDFVVQTGLSSSNVAGGERDVSVLTRDIGNPVASFATANLSTGAGDDAVVLMSDGDTILRVFYNLPTGPVDLTGGGLLDRFVVQVTSAVGSAVLVVFVSDTSSTSEQFSNQLLSGPGLIELPFSQFTGSTDFTAVDRISFDLVLESGGAYSMWSISTLPEPSAALQLAAGAAMLSSLGWMRGPKRRRPARNGDPVPQRG